MVKSKEEKYSKSCCSWKLMLSLLAVIQVLLILGYQGFFSVVKSFTPVHFVSQKINNLNIHVHHIGRDSWLFSEDENKESYVNISPNSLQNNTTTKILLDVDIHPEDNKYGHTWEEIQAHKHKENDGIIKNSIAIGMGITSRKTRWGSKYEIKKTFPFFKSLLPTFCKTASKGFSYNFFMAYDKDDGFYTKLDNLFTLQEVYYSFVNEKCPKGSNYTIHFVQCSHKKQPARAQNDAMMAAYMSNMEYYYRINDDTKMKSTGWTEAFINTLKQFNPPNVGVVGPNHRGGNTAILTYDFVHYTHIHIHGLYYPRELTDWFADRWITDIYRPDRCIKLKSALLDHTMESGQRYTHHNNPKVRDKLKYLIESGKQIINRYTLMLKKDIKPSSKNVISFSLSGKNPQQTYGAIRNAQLWPVIFPNWKFRVYMIDPVALHQRNSSFNFLVPKQVINKLRLLGAEIVFLNLSYLKIPSSLWKYLVADDKSVEHFLVRNTDGRLNEKDFNLTTDWLAKTKTQPVFCVRDKLGDATKPIVAGLFGAESTMLNKLLKANITSFISTAVNDSLWVNENAENHFLHSFIWPRIDNETVCFDGTSKDSKFPKSIQIPESVSKLNDKKLGTIYNEFGDVIS